MAALEASVASVKGESSQYDAEVRADLEACLEDLQVMSDKIQHGRDLLRSTGNATKEVPPCSPEHNRRDV